MHVRISSPTLSCRFLDNSMSAAAHSAGSSKPTSTTSSVKLEQDGDSMALEVELLLGFRASKDMKFTSGIRVGARRNANRQTGGGAAHRLRVQQTPRAAPAILETAQSEPIMQLVSQARQKLRNMAMKMMAMTPVTTATIANCTSQRESSEKRSRLPGRKLSRLEVGVRTIAGKGGMGA
jgi:hypothetical protein